ncbi:hypothetical protein D5086_032164 [Populus alba]|uniref:Uncharacterized protein n=1 Tax=Populus alba TaxID=43335 RepID=A0ACC4AL82_POPAL
MTIEMANRIPLVLLLALLAHEVVALSYFQNKRTRLSLVSACPATLGNIVDRTQQDLEMSALRDQLQENYEALTGADSPHRVP